MRGRAEECEERDGAARGLLLLIDTCGADGSIALAEAGAGMRVLRSGVMAGRSASERLFSELRGMLAAEGRTAEEISAIAVVRGPGSFTGIRVGVASAKGLAEALRLPVVGLSRLAVLASLVRVDGERELGTERLPEAGRDIAAVLAAGRGEFFCGRFRAGERQAMWEALLTREAAVERCAGARVVVCEPDVVSALPELGAELLELPGAGAALGPALDCLRAGRFDDVSVLDGYYLRRTPAEMALDDVERLRGSVATGS